MSRPNTPYRLQVYVVFGLLDVCVVAMVGIVMWAALLPPLESVIYISTPTKRQPVVRSAITGTPNRVVVPSLAIDVPVQTGSYSTDSRSWTTSSDAVFYADRTVVPNNHNGTTLVYGHAEWPLFGRLPDVGSGAVAKVYTEEGLVFSYMYEARAVVSPTDTAILTSEGPPVLALQTCYGAFDAYRLLVTFRFTGVVKA